MFFFLELAHLAYQATRTILGVSMVLLHSYDLPSDLNSVVHIQAERSNYRDIGKNCVYDGVMVPYARDWEEIDNTSGMEVVRRAEPAKLAGYALIFYKKSCDTGVETVLRMGTDFHHKKVVHQGQKIDVSEYDFGKLDLLPKWLEQVKGRLAQFSSENAAVAEALTAIRAQGIALPAIVAGPVFTDPGTTVDPLYQTMLSSDQEVAQKSITWAVQYNIN